MRKKKDNNTEILATDSIDVSINKLKASFPFSSKITWFDFLWSPFITHYTELLEKFEERNIEEAENLYNVIKKYSKYFIEKQKSCKKRGIFFKGKNKVNKWLDNIYILITKMAQEFTKTKEAKKQ